MRAEPKSTTQSAYLLLMLAMVAFGGTWVAGKFAVDAIPPATVATGRFALAALLLWGWERVRRASHRRIATADLPIILMLGATAVAGYNIVFLYGLRLAPASDGAIIVPGFAPILTTALAWPLLRERIDRAGIVGLFVGLAGIVLVIRPEGTQGPARLSGDLLFFGGAVLWAVYSLLGRAATTRFTPARATLFAFVSGTLMLLPFALWERGWRPLLRAPTLAWVGLLYLAVFGSVVAFVFFYEGVHRVGAVRATPFTFLVPIVGVVSSVIALGERLSSVTLGGGVLVLFGLWIVQRRPTALPTAGASTGAVPAGGRPV